VSGRGLSAGVAVLLLALPGCHRLNPAWCEEHASCLAGEYCDPATNTCRRREAGVSLDHGLDQGRDITPADHATGEAVQDPDLAPGPDTLPLDASPKPDLPPGPG